MRKTLDYEIKGDGVDPSWTVRVTSLGGRKAQRIYLQIVAVVGTGLGRLKIGDDGSMDSAEANFGEAVNMLLTAKGEHQDPLDKITRAFEQTTQIKTRPDGTFVQLTDVYDEVFAGAMDRWSEWVQICVGHNFPKLLSGVLPRQGTPLG